MRSAYAQENVVRKGRDSALSLDDGFNPSNQISTLASTRQVEGPFGRLVAPKAVPLPAESSWCPVNIDDVGVLNPEQSRRAATLPIHPRQWSQITVHRSTLIQLEPSPS